MSDQELENEFRAMFAERSEDVRVTTSPYQAVRKRIVVARRKRRRRIGSAGAAVAVAVVGIGAWAATSGSPQGALPPASVGTGPATPGATTGPTPGGLPAPVRGAGPVRLVYDDGTTELPAGPLHDAAVEYIAVKYPGDLSGLTVVTTFNRAMQKAADGLQSPNTIGMAVLDPKNGYVKALRGRWSETDTLSDTFKPITLAAAFQTGHYTPDSAEPANTALHPVYAHDGDREPLTYQDAAGKQRNWPPEPGGLTVQGDSLLTLHNAVTFGANAPFAYLELSPFVGVKPVRDTAVALGIPSEARNLLAVPALTLGLTEASPLTMATVYGTFAAGGVRHDPLMVSAIRDAKGATVWQPDTSGKRVLSQKAAQQVSDTLSGVLTQGSAASNQLAKSMGAKGLVGIPGTDSEDHVTWFDGYGPDLVATLVLTHTSADGEPAKLVYDSRTLPPYGTDTVTPMWAAFMSQFAH